jgi:pyridoxine 5-phosphate synthase
MTRLSVNINKIATLRNARGGEVPKVLTAAQRCQEYGGQGITVHPRPDERHITYEDVRALPEVIHTEFNVEGYPGAAFMELVLKVKPQQVTLVPDDPNVLTSNAGWDTQLHQLFLKETVQRLHGEGIRTSLFMECDDALLEAAAQTGTDRIELYTEAYARHYAQGQPEKAVAPYVAAAQKAHELGMGVNAGHDLDLDNLQYFAQQVPHLEEVSIGHALIADALYLGLENTIQRYLRALEMAQHESA